MADFRYIDDDKVTLLNGCLEFMALGDDAWSDLLLAEMDEAQESLDAQRFAAIGFVHPYSERTAHLDREG